MLCLSTQGQPGQDDLHYASVQFSKNQTDSLYSNIRPAQRHRRKQEEEESVEYAAVKFNSASTAPRWAALLTGTLVSIKPQNEVFIFQFFSSLTVAFAYLFTFLLSPLEICISWYCIFRITWFLFFSSQMQRSGNWGGSNCVVQYSQQNCLTHQESLVCPFFHV